MNIVSEDDETFLMKKVDARHQFLGNGGSGRTTGFSAVATASGERKLNLLYMVIEHFKNRDAKSVYRRFRDRGRMAPPGLTYVESWVETNFDRCFQLMECDDTKLLKVWATHWQDLVEFEFVPVRRSKEALEIITPQL
jgi:hypothetical protein